MSKSLAMLLAFAFLGVALLAPLDVVRSEGETYGLDVSLPSGAHVYVTYDVNWTTEEKLLVNGYLSTYVPIMWDEFWSINKTAYVTMIRGDFATYRTGNWASGRIIYDGPNVASYDGTVALYAPQKDPADGSWYKGWLSGLLHEWTHLFQFWTPNYFSVARSQVEAVANAFSWVLVVETLGSSSREFHAEIMPDTGELLDSQVFGRAAYARSVVWDSYHLMRGWTELWSYDHLAFKKFNTYIASLSGSPTVGVRDVVRQALFESYASYSYDGLSVDDWLDGFGFFNSVSDLPSDVRMMWWLGNNAWHADAKIIDGVPMQFQGQVFVKQQNVVKRIPINSSEILITDGQTREVLYSGTKQAMPDGTTMVTSWNNEIPFRDLMRIDTLNHLSDGTDLPVTAYLAGRDSVVGNRVIFFLNREGYAEGAGTSNVGVVNNGVLKWTTGGHVEAQVTFQNRTYTYEVDNVMADPATPMVQITVPLYESRTLISPLTQNIMSNESAKLELHLSPKVSSGNVTVYHSTNLIDWSPITSVTPTNGYARFDLQPYPLGLHYFKASWNGDAVLDSSESSIVKVNVTSTEPVIPEFPSSIFMTLMMVPLLSGALFFRSKFLKTRK